MESFRWDLAASLGRERIEKLSASPAFDIVAQSIRDNMEVLCCHSDLSTDIEGFDRFIFCVRVAPELFDLFFNSRTGYRAAYYRSPFDGLWANQQFIHTLLPELLAFDSGRNAKRAQVIEESMTSPSAKVWVAEAEWGLCSNCDGEWIEPKDALAEIQNDRWERGEDSNAMRGRKAPVLTKIRVIGAFLNSRLDEFVPCRKRHRAVDIHERGWA